MDNIIAFLKAAYQSDPTREYIDRKGTVHKARQGRQGDCLVALTYVDGRLTLSRVSSRKSDVLVNGRPVYVPCLTNAVSVRAETVEQGVQKLLNGKHNKNSITVSHSGYRTLTISANKTDISLTSLPSANNPARSKSVVCTKKSDLQKLSWLPYNEEKFVEMVKQAKLTYGLQSSDIVDL